jgi:hypothetical protein
MRWHEIESPRRGESLYTDVAEVAGGCLVRTYGWENNNFETAMGVGLVFIPGVSLSDFEDDEE